MAQKPGPETITLAAESGDFSRLQAFVERVCTAAGCDAGQVARTQLVIEELFTNTIKYGRTESGMAAVTVTANPVGDTTLIMCYEDTAPAHDPFGNPAKAEDLLVSLTHRRVGGLGVVMIQQLGRNVRYERVDGKNRVIFSVAAHLPT